MVGTEKLPGGDAVRTRTHQVQTLDDAANAERYRLTRRMSVEGKTAVGDFDVFMAHNSDDREVVGHLVERLRDVGISPWVDTDEVPPGRWFQHYIQDAIGRVGSAAIMIGPSGLGKWQALELRSFISACIERDLPVIPVLLPKASWPDEVQFLRELHGVLFAENIEDAKPFAWLCWGITGDRDLRDRLAGESFPTDNRQPGTPMGGRGSRLSNWWLQVGSAPANTGDRRLPRRHLPSREP